MDGVKPFARQVRRGAVRQMAAGGERHAEHRVAGLQQRQKHRLIGRRAGMRLHIGEAAPEQARRALDRQPLGDIDELAAAVIAPPGIALGILVRQDRALRFEHRPRHDVLAGDQLDLRLLAAQLAIDRRGDLRVGGGQGLEKNPVPRSAARPDSRGNRQDSTSFKRKNAHLVPIRRNLPYIGRQCQRATRHRSIATPRRSGFP